MTDAPRAPDIPSKRIRIREPRDDVSPGMSNAVPWEQRGLFALLMSEGGDGAGGGGGASLAGLKASADVSMIHALTEQLVPQMLGASQWPLVAVLYMPRLGRINASVRRELGAWNVELEAEEASTARWLGGVRQRCQEGLVRSLGVPVNVSLTGAGTA